MALSIPLLLTPLNVLITPPWISLKLVSLFASTTFFTCDLLTNDLVSLNCPLGTNLGMVLAYLSRGFQVVVTQVLVGVVAIWLKKCSVVESWEGEEQPA
jgi:hypothetical protein